MTDQSLVIQRPRVVSTHRANPNTVSIGDEVTLEFEAGLLRFLETANSSGGVLADGFPMEWTVPLGAGAYAAIAVTDPPVRRGLNMLGDVTLDVAWHRAWKSNEPLVAHCRIASLGTSSVRLPFRVVSSDDGSVIVEGEYHYVNVTEAGPRPIVQQSNAPPARDAGRRNRSLKARVAEAMLPKAVVDRLRQWYWRRLEPQFDSAQAAVPAEATSVASPLFAVSKRPADESELASQTIDLLHLRSPILVSSTKESESLAAGDVWTWTFPNDLYQFLVKPVKGGALPLELRVHLASNIQVAMSVHAATRMTPGVPLEASIQWLNRVEGGTDFDLRSEVVSVDEDTVVTNHLVSEGGMAKTKVALTLRRTSRRGIPRAPRTVPDANSVAPTGHDITEILDLAPRIALLNPDYLRDEVTGGSYQSRIQTVHYSTSDGLLYVLYANAFVFTSADGCRTLQEVREVNYRDGQLVNAATNSTDVVVDTMRRTVLLLGTDDRDGASRGVVWRKQFGETAFTRTVVMEDPWPVSKAGNATAGFFGRQSMDMIAVSMYVPGAHFYFSTDDGHSWRKQDVSHLFAEHVHEVYLPRGSTPGRPARLWVSGGDDPGGEQSGVVCYDDFVDGGLAGLGWVLRERPGYRLVALAGNGKHVFIGNESLAGGLLKILDNQEAIDAADFEYVLGKNRHDYHQFRTLLTTVDGFLVSATDSYNFIGDSVRADSGGYLYISGDEGATFREIPLAGKWVTGLAYDGRAFWVSLSWYRENGVDTSDQRLTLLRIPKPSPFATLQDPYCAKAVIVDSSPFYEMAKYPVHPRAKLEAGERTFRADLSKYRSISVAIDTWGPASLVVEALPFYNWSLAQNRWIDVAEIEIEREGSQQIMLPDVAAHNRFFRVRNAGNATAEFRSIVFIGKS